MARVISALCQEPGCRRRSVKRRGYGAGGVGGLEDGTAAGTGGSADQL